MASYRIQSETHDLDHTHPICDVSCVTYVNADARDGEPTQTLEIGITYADFAIDAAQGDNARQRLAA